MQSVKNVCRITGFKFLRPFLSSNFSTTTKIRKDVGNEVESQPYDIIITGGGMVGSALAAAIGHSNILRHKRVLLLESGGGVNLKEAPEDFSSAVCALSHSTKQLLTSFGAWDKLLRKQKVHHMRVWDSGSEVGISFDLDAQHSSSSSSSSSSSFLSGLFSTAPSVSSLSELAYIVENNVILSAINAQLAASDVKVKHHSKVLKYLLPSSQHSSPHYPTVVLEGGQQLSTKLLVGADGWNSLLRRSANIRTIGWPYKQNAVVATVAVEEDRGNNTAWQRFLPKGPIALLPLSDQFSCLIWTTSGHHSKHLLSIPPEDFVNQVNHAYCDLKHVSNNVTKASHLLQDVLLATGIGGQASSKMLPPTVTGVVGGSRKAFPLSLCHANHYVKEGIALIGDAAHRVHPLSGQGVNLGFGDVATLLETLETGVLEGANIGSLSMLAEYEKSRQTRVLGMMAGIDLLNRCYSNQSEVLLLLRSLVCQVADSVPFVKQKMIQFATA